MEVTQKMIDIVADEWGRQNKDCEYVDLNPGNCIGMNQEQIDATAEWLHNNIKLGLVT